MIRGTPVLKRLSGRGLLFKVQFTPAFLERTGRTDSILSHGNLSLTGVRTLFFSGEMGYRAPTEFSLNSMLVILLGVTGCRFIKNYMLVILLGVTGCRFIKVF